MTFFHYTSLAHLEVMIRGGGLILPTESNVGGVLPWEEPYGMHVGPDVVWLLDDSDPFAHSHGLVHSMVDKREVRIEVNVPAVRWLDWEPVSRMNPKWRETFINAGGGPLAVEHWHVWPASIKFARWVGVDHRVEDEWVRKYARPVKQP